MGDDDDDAEDEVPYNRAGEVEDDAVEEDNHDIADCSRDHPDEEEEVLLLDNLHSAVDNHAQEGEEEEDRDHDHDFHNEDYDCRHHRQSDLRRRRYCRAVGAKENTKSGADHDRTDLLLHCARGDCDCDYANASDRDEQEAVIESRNETMLCDDEKKKRVAPLRHSPSCLHRRDDVVARLRTTSFSSQA